MCVHDLTDARRKDEIEYPAGGGGVYSRTTDYILLQHLLKLLTCLSDSSISRPTSPILSDNAVQSLFSPILPEPTLDYFITLFNRYLSLSESEQVHMGMEIGPWQWRSFVRKTDNVGMDGFDYHVL